jgi:hypothetical protein
LRGETIFGYDRVVGNLLLLWCIDVEFNLPVIDLLHRNKDSGEKLGYISGIPVHIRKKLLL